MAAQREPRVPRRQVHRDEEAQPRCGALARLDLCDERGVLVWNEALAWGNSARISPSEVALPSILPPLKPS